MTLLHEWLALQSAWLWPKVADHLWQATVFAFIVLAATLALKRAPASARHSFWLLASAKFIVPAALLVFLAEQAGAGSLWLFSAAQGTGQNALLLHSITEPISMIASYELTVSTDAARHNEIYCALTGLWLAGCLALLVFWTMRRRKFLQALKLGRTVREGREWEILERVKESLNMKADIGLVISPHKTEPTVCRVWKPVVMLPESIAEHLDDSELKAIMLHELVHIQRRDNLIGILQMAICALLWFHPLVWFINRKIFDEREQACDEKVLQIYGAPDIYASSILKVVRFCFGWRVAGVTGAGSGSNLRRRIENIMSTDNKRRSAAAWPRLLAGSLVGCALVLLVAAGVYSRGRDEINQSESSAVAIPGDRNISSTDQSDQTPKRAEPTRLANPVPPTEPTQPAQPQPPQPAQGTQPPQPAQATQPPQPTQPTNPPSQPTTPAPPTIATPPSPPAAPATAAQQKRSDKSKEKAEQKNDELVKGELIEAPPPVYPEEAKKQKIEGTVTVKIVIGEEGKVVSARATGGPEPLHGASVEAAYKARFKPTVLNGTPVKVAGAMTYNFVLDEK